MNYRFLSPALSELAEAAEYYESKVPGLGLDFVKEADATISRILQFPEAWGRIGQDHRHCDFRRFPYSVIYSIIGGSDVLIVSVFHQSRKPLAWKQNL